MKIKDGVFAFSSMGMSIKGYRPKRPSELLCAIAEQYEEKEVTRWGQEVRGGRGKKKTKEFFRVRVSFALYEAKSQALTCDDAVLSLTGTFDVVWH